MILEYWRPGPYLAYLFFVFFVCLGQNLYMDVYKYMYFQEYIFIFDVALACLSRQRRCMQPGSEMAAPCEATPDRVLWSFLPCY